MSSCIRSSIWRKFRRIKGNVTVNVSRNLSPLGNRYIFAIHEKKQWGRWKENNCRCNDGPGHCTLVPSTFCFLDGAQRNLLPVRKLYVINIDIELPFSAHSTLRLGLSNRSPSKSATRNHNDIVKFHFLKNFKVQRVVDMGVGGGNGAICSQLHRSTVLQSKWKGLLSGRRSG